MRKQIAFMISAAFLLSATTIIIGVPDAVEKAFKEKFPKAKNVEWQQEEDGTYEAEFELKGAEHEVVFKEDGTWVYTAVEMNINEYSAMRKELILSTNPGYEIEKVMKVEHAEHGDCYLIKLENEEGAERKILTLKTGKVISTKDKKEYDDEDEEDEEENE